jgi:hypothetical protein
VTVSGGQADPDHPVTVRFTIGGRTYTVNNVYYPDGDSQLVSVASPWLETGLLQP